MSRAPTCPPRRRHRHHVLSTNTKTYKPQHTGPAQAVEIEKEFAAEGISVGALGLDPQDMAKVGAAKLL